MEPAQLQPGADDIIKVSGALTFGTVNQLWEQSQSLFVNAQPQIRFDLANVTQSDSAGVALLLAWSRAARLHKKQIEFLALPKQMQDIAKVGGVTAILPGVAK